MTTVQKIFFELLKAGLWERNNVYLPEGDVDIKAVHKLAEEQSIVGLIAAGLEQAKDVRITQADRLAFVTDVIALEHNNNAMNGIVSKLFDKFQSDDISVLLVKGQGIAQCYERPLWRACGDIDLLINGADYEKVKKELVPLATYIDEEDERRQHLALTIDTWCIELHGTMRTGLWNSLDRLIDDVQRYAFSHQNKRTWLNNQTHVNLPSADEDVIIVFSHILQHFYVEGIGLRQICDWCRLLSKYHDVIDEKLLERRLIATDILFEWRTMAAMTVKYMGMTPSSIPLYAEGSVPVWKTKLLMSLIIETGNFGHNRDMSYKKKYPYLIRLAISFLRNTKYDLRCFLLFPKHSLIAWWKMVRLAF